MQKVLLVVDVQKENSEGVERFADKLSHWIDAHAHEYQYVVATIRKNTKVDNFERYLKDYSCADPELCRFHYDKLVAREGYSLDEVGYKLVPKTMHVDVVGMETQGAIMAIALDLFSLGYDFSVLKDYCYCNDGRGVHKAALQCLKESIGTALK